MSSPQTPLDERRFDDELEEAISGMAPVARGELATARFLAAELAPLAEVPAGAQERIWQRVQTRIAAQPRRRLASPSRVRPVRQRWAVAAAVALLALLTALGAIGPQRVWAQVQRLFGYVPGMGFVDLDQARVLAAPVAVTREGVTLYVEQAVAQPSGTTVVIDTAGLPPADRLSPQGVDADYAPTLRLADGRVLAHRGYQLRTGAGTVEFPPLPEGVYRVTLVLPRLPLVPAGAAPEAWEVPLVLRPATGELAAALFPQRYRPEGAEDTREGVTLRVLDVAQGPQETALRFAMAWGDPRWEPFPGIDNAYLKDDLGHVYWEAVPPASGSLVETEVIAIDPAAPAPAAVPATHEETRSFSPASPLARQLTLVVEGITFRVPADASFAVDLGPNPQVGDSWPLDVELQVAGFPVRIVGARLVEEVTGPREAPERRTALQFDALLGPEQGGLALAGLDLDGGAAGFTGAGGQGNPRSGRVQVEVYVAEGQPIPHGTVRVGVRDAGLTVRGPWAVSWRVPGAEPGTPAAPVALHPGEARQRRGDLTLRVAEAVLSDRLTYLRLALDGAPEGVTLSGLSWASVAARQSPTMCDDRRRDYGLPNSRGVAWRPAGEDVPDPTALAFGPLQPLARRLTLRLRGVLVDWPAKAAFDVDVPAGVPLEPAGEGRPWRASAPWTVDVPLEVAGYRLRFAQAQLEEVNGTTMLSLSSAPYAPAGRDRWLAGLRLAAVTAADGRAVDVTPAMSAAGPAGEGQAAHTAWLIFDVVDPATGAVQPGRYHVELAGVTVAVRGPWELTWWVAGNEVQR